MARLFAFFKLFHLSLTFFRPEVTFIPTPEQGDKFKMPVAHTRLINVESPRGTGSTTQKYFQKNHLVQILSNESLLLLIYPAKTNV